MMSADGVWEVARRLVTGVVVIGFLALCKRYIPPPKADRSGGELYSPTLAVKFTVNGSMLLISIFLAFGIHSILVTSSEFATRRQSDLDVVIHPSPFIWWFLPGFAAICLCWEITFKLWSTFYPLQANAYRAYSNVKSGMDSTKVLSWMALVIVLPIAIGTILAIPVSTTLTPTAINSVHYASVHPEVLQYANATDLVQFDGYLDRGGSFIPRAGLLVRFNDGKTWNSADTGDPKNEVDPALIRIIENGTHLPLRFSHVEPKAK